MLNPQDHRRPLSRKRKIEPSSKRKRSQSQLPTPPPTTPTATAEEKSKERNTAATTAGGAAVPSNVERLTDLDLPPPLRAALSNLDIGLLSPLQRRIIPALLAGRDAVAVAAPGRDAMLAFLIPAVALLHRHRFLPRHGTGVVVVTASRETAVQMCALASELLLPSPLAARTAARTAGVVLDGANFGAEAGRLERGVSLLVATPARLLLHMRETPAFVFKNTKALCLYAPDPSAAAQLEEMRDVVARLPRSDRLSMLFAGEHTDQLHRLAELACRSAGPVERYSDTGTDTGMLSGSPAIESQQQHQQPQGYVMVEADKRFLLLYSFLKKFQHKKVAVVLSSTPSVLFAAEVLDSLDVPVHAVHGKQAAKARIAAFAAFVADAKATLLVTEEAVQSLEMPSAVDWAIQYDPPRSIREFVRRRGKMPGRPVAFVQPAESGFVDKLKENADGCGAVQEFDFPPKKLLNVQPQIEKLVSKSFAAHQLAKEAFRVFIQDYNYHADSQVFDATKLDVKKVAKAFGFDTPPRVAVKTVAEAKVDRYARPYAPPKPREGKRRKAL